MERRKRLKKLLILFLVFMTLAVAYALPASALNWNGTSVKSVGASNAQGTAGYTIRLVGEDGCFGYRFSVVDASGNTKSKSGYPSAIDVYRDISLDYTMNKVYNSYNSASTKYNKKQLITNRSSVSLSMTAIKNQSNSFIASKMGFASALPAPSGMEMWQSEKANLNKVLEKLGQGSVGNFVYGDRLLVEPLFAMQIGGGNYNAMTITEIALYGAAFYGDSSSNGGASYNSGTWGFVASYTNMYFPRTLFTANSTMLGNLWGTASNLTSKTSFENIITKGYGVGIAYSNYSSYTVTLQKGTGIASVSGNGTYSAGQSVKINATLQTGYKWKNWTGTKAASAKEYTFSMPASNVVNKANGEAISYTIKHDPNGGSWSGDSAVDSRSYTIESSVYVIVPPTRTGYSFSGWKVTSASGNWTLNKVYTVSKSAILLSGMYGDVTLTAQWTKNSYTVTYNANGGSGAPGNQTKNHGVDLTLSSTKPTRTGYAFSRWNTNANGSGTSYNPGAKYTGNANLTLYAIWTPNKLTVCYDCYGSAAKVSDSSKGFFFGDYNRICSTSSKNKTIAGTNNVYYQSFKYNNVMDGNGLHDFKTFGLSAPKGYKFIGWKGGNKIFDQKAATYKPTDFTSDINNGDAYIWLTAQFAPIKYTVIFDGNGNTGGATASVSMTYDTAKNLTANGFSKTGYTFKSWNTKADGSGTTYTDKQSVKNLSSTNNATVTLYAIWTPNTYIVSYNANGGDGAPGNQTKTHGVDLSLSSKTPTRAGYTFAKWNTNASGTGTSYNPSGKYTANSAVTLYAVWIPNTYTVSYNANGGDGAPGNQTKTYGVDLTLSSKTPTRAGYTFGKWNTNASGTGTSYNPSGKYTANSAVTLYAVWIPNTYTVSYNANGGDGAPGNQTKTHGVDLSLSSKTPTRAGYTFGKWNTDANGKGTSYNPSGKYTANSAVTLYAVWIPNTYTVSYNANGGDGAPGNQTKTHGVDLTLSSKTPTRAGYTFGKWNTNASGTGTSYNPSGKYTANSAVTLYAVWIPNTYTVSYNANGGDGAPGNQTKTHGVDLTLSSKTPTRAGYNFTKWNTSSDGKGTNYDPGAKYKGNANLTLYAQWESARVLSLEAVAPNAPYRENTEVVTSFYLLNSGTLDCIPSDHISVVFKVYKDSSCIKTVTRADVAVPKNDKNILYFKWTVPADLGNSGISISGEIVENGGSYGLVKRGYETTKYTISATPDTQFEIGAPDGFVKPSLPAERNGNMTWSEWSYVNGAFKKTNYGIGISNDSASLKPAASANALLKNGVWVMKSGYGVEISLKNGYRSVSGYTMPSSDAFTSAQYASALFPEFSYSANANGYRTLELVSGNWIFRENGDYGRIHFTPLWYPDGDYTASVLVSDFWTPAGMISRAVNTNTITISGSAYDDWYLG